MLLSLLVFVVQFWAVFALPTRTRDLAPRLELPAGIAASLPPGVEDILASLGGGNIGGASPAEGTKVSVTTVSAAPAKASVTPVAGEAEKAKEGEKVAEPAKVEGAEKAGVAEGAKAGEGAAGAEKAEGEAAAGELEVEGKFDEAIALGGNDVKTDVLFTKGVCQPSKA